MDIIFFNKNRPLMMLDLDLKTSYVKEIKYIYDKDAMPLAMFSEDEKELGENFTRWWRDRSIPASRHELRKKMEPLYFLDVQEVINHSF